jgi:hypothetical protein
MTYRLLIGVLLVGTCALILGGCSSPASPEPTPVAAIPRPNLTSTPERPLALAVAVGSPTATPALVGDYPTLVRPRLEHIQQGFTQLEQQLAVLQKDPIRMAQDDWRNQLLGILDGLAISEADLRTLGSRVIAPPALNSEMVKFIDDLDFVVSEWRMALDYDPDASHFIRASRAEKMTANEVESILSELRRPIGPAPTPTPAR